MVESVAGLQRQAEVMAAQHGHVLDGRWSSYKPMMSSCQNPECSVVAVIHVAPVAQIDLGPGIDRPCPAKRQPSGPREYVPSPRGGLPGNRR